MSKSKQISRSLPASLLVLGLSLSRLAAAADAPAEALIQCSYKAEEPNALCLVDRGVYGPCAMHTVRIEHRGANALGALGTDKPGTARLLSKSSENYVYTWKNVWADGLAVDLDSSATAWDEFTIATKQCNTRRTTVNLNVKDPSKSSVSFFETTRECGGMSWLAFPSTDKTETRREAVCTITSPIQPWAPAPVVKYVPKPAPASATTQVGAVFTNVSAQYPQFSEAWLAPNGLVWSGHVKKGGRTSTKYGPGVNEDSKVLPYCNNGDSYADDCWTSNAKAAAYCQSIGARLPTIDEIKQLAVYMGAGSDPKAQNRGYYPQVMTEMAGSFPIATADPSLCFWESYNNITPPMEGEKTEDKILNAIRCVTSASN
jgi:hypothetical protein